MQEHLHESSQNEEAFCLAPSKPTTWSGHFSVMAFTTKINISVVGEIFFPLVRFSMQKVFGHNTPGFMMLHIRLSA